ncbi:MAG: enoyl-CoA hydratase/isomerase family protein, partial [Burkholderiales bacterium]
RVVADGEVEREAFATAERIAAGAPLVARWHKRFIERLSARAELTPVEWDEGFACFDTEDYREGIDAFLGKRKPRFQGR